MALASVLFNLPARHTSTLFIFGFCLTTMRLSRRFRVGGLLFGERMAALPGRHRVGRGLLRLPRLSEAARRQRCAAIIAGASFTGKFARHIYVYLFCGRRFCSSRWDGCCCARAGLRSGWAAAGPTCEALKTYTSWQTHGICIFSTSFLVNTSGRAPGCCCGGDMLREHRCWRSGLHVFSKGFKQERAVEF